MSLHYCLIAIGSVSDCYGKSWVSLSEVCVMPSLPAEQSVVILGAGVIGLSTAYYISTSSQPPANIYVLDSSPILFQCASGRAAGFIAKDWFNSSLSELGELSFRLHRELSD